jgi:hypothetical protein
MRSKQIKNVETSLSTAGRRYRETEAKLMPEQHEAKVCGEVEVGWRWGGGVKGEGLRWRW